MSEKKGKDKQVEVYITRSPKGYAYFAGEVVGVSPAIAKRLKEMNCARDPEQTLPKDIPHREDLIKEGLESVDLVKEAKDLTKVPGIGKAGAAEINEYLSEKE